MPELRRTDPTALQRNPLRLACVPQHRTVRVLRRPGPPPLDPPEATGRAARMIVTMCVWMVFKDLFGTLLVIAESKGRSVLGGALDGSMDVAALLSIRAGVLALPRSGIAAQMFVCACLWVTAFTTTSTTTHFGKRLKADP